MAQLLLIMCGWIIFVASARVLHEPMETESSQIEALMNYYNSKRLRLRTGFEDLSPPDQEEIFKASGIDALFSIGSANRFLSQAFHHENSPLYRPASDGFSFRHLRTDRK